MRTLQESSVVAEADKKLLRDLKAIVAQFEPTAEMLLYGSVARGTAGPESDYDVLVLTDEKLTRTQEDPIRDAVYDLQLDRGVVISLIFFAKAEWDSALFHAMPFHSNVLEDALVL